MRFDLGSGLRLELWYNSAAKANTGFNSVGNKIVSYSTFDLSVQGYFKFHQKERLGVVLQLTADSSSILKLFPLIKS